MRAPPGDVCEARGSRRPRRNRDKSFFVCSGLDAKEEDMVLVCHSLHQLAVKSDPARPERSGHGGHGNLVTHHTSSDMADPDGELDNDDYEEGSEEAEVFSEDNGSDSDIPRTFTPMPPHLALPLELQRLILSLETSQFQCTWGSYRFVCKAWNEYILELAEKRWIPNAAFHYRGYMTRDSGLNKVLLGGAFEFSRMDGDNAIFASDSSEEHRKAFIKACKATSPPDVEVCMLVHDVQIPGMTVDWDALTITCPWRNLVGRVLAEELRVEEFKKTSYKKLILAAKELRSQGMDGIYAMLDMYANHLDDAYSSVRRERLGYVDKAGDERLKQLRVSASLALLEDEGESVK
ncbi:hypothetical protein MIND_00324800 [Mycena indigotica]|uniref:Uncharacterized protein n=1 Tax=Mycena indigotica TaxID=2126181 RepID=A0A8H6T296_9AGAR|nr:uncharacterized protein MIND_00324800 [Mycena indigotica]KAF7309540.1 hypothetical protein MIND_00324800 [Mycena indigotica]